MQQYRFRTCVSNGHDRIHQYEKIVTPSEIRKILNTCQAAATKPHQIQYHIVCVQTHLSNCLMKFTS